MVTRFCSFTSSTAVNMTSLCFCLPKAAFTASWFFRRREIISSVEFHLVHTSCMSGSFSCPSLVCSWCISAVLAGLCLKWPTMVQHFASASVNPLPAGLTVMVLCKMCVSQGMCWNGRCFAAVIMVLAPSVPLWWPFVEYPRSLPQRQIVQRSFQHSVWCLSSAQSGHCSRLSAVHLLFGVIKLLDCAQNSLSARQLKSWIRRCYL